MRRLLLTATLVLLGTLALTRPASAQNGPYYATPSWDQTLACTTVATCPRFIVLAGFGNEAVLDRETGLVWEQSPSTALVQWATAQSSCNNKNVGNRKGWRLPTVQELASLIDSTQSDPALPPGSVPGIFSNVQLAFPPWYWAATSAATVANSAWLVGFNSNGNVGPPVEKINAIHVWCVRGGQGTDAQ